MSQPQNEPHKDGFILFSADLPDQFAWSVSDEMSSADAEGWFEAYSGFETYSAAIADAEDTARSTFEASRNGDIDDDYESLDDVGRDTVLRVRVFDDGRVHVYDCAPGRVSETANISEDEEPIRKLTTDDVLRFTGSEMPKLREDEAGPSV